MELPSRLGFEGPRNLVVDQAAVASWDSNIHLPLMLLQITSEQ